MTRICKTDGSILIFHDQDGLTEIFKSLIDHMRATGYDFLPMNIANAGSDMQ